MMDQNKLQELRELVEFLKSNGIAEFDMERDDLKVRIKFMGANVAAAAPNPAQLAALLGSAGASFQTVPPASAAPAGTAALAVDADEGLHQVKSPIVGTFYESPSPGASPFVKVGDQVEVGQVLCIVEAMKLMNEIEADASGEIVKMFVSNGAPVEYGMPLFGIRKS